MQGDLKSSLAGLKVIDLGRGMASAVAAKLLGELDANVQRFEPKSGDPFYKFYAAYAVWHARSQVHRIDAADDASLHAAIALSDVCIVNGEDFPGYGWQHDAQALARCHPHLVIVEIQSYPQDCDCAGRAAVELLVQARSGLCFEQYGDRPNAMSYAPGSFGAALNALTAMFAALCERQRSGAGQIVRSSLYEGMLMLAAGAWLSASKPTAPFRFMLPKSPHFLIFKCRDGRYIHFTFGSAGAKSRVYGILGIDDPSVGPDDAGMPNGRGEPKNFFGDVDLLAEYVARFDSAELFEKISDAGVGVSYVLAPGECWGDAQVQHADIIERDTQGGRHVGLPMHGRIALQGAQPLLKDTGEKPLAGVRVVDFGIFVAGPYASVALADLGADVIKVETVQGDPVRAIVRSFTAANRGKRAIAIDMKSPEGMQIAAKLCASAQIIHSNFRPGASARLGIDPATQHALDADKIVLETNAWGRSGPQGQRPGFDMIFQAYCGHEIRGGGSGSPPMCDRAVMVDCFAGALGTLATIIAVWRRVHGAGGADLELSLLDSGLFLLSELIQIPTGEFQGAPRLNQMQTGFHPAEALYQCADGWIAISARGEAMAATLAQRFGFALRPRAQWDQLEAAAIGAELRKRDSGDAQHWLESVGVWTEVCTPSGESLIERRDGVSPSLVLATEHPQFGIVRQIGSLFRMARGRSNSVRGAPALGADSRELLVELGYSPSEIEDLYTRRLVA